MSNAPFIDLLGMLEPEIVARITQIPTNKRGELVIVVFDGRDAVARELHLALSLGAKEFGGREVPALPANGCVTTGCSVAMIVAAMRAIGKEVTAAQFDPLDDGKYRVAMFSDGRWALLQVPAPPGLARGGIA